MFRLHIDVLLSPDEEVAKLHAGQILDALKRGLAGQDIGEGYNIQFRLANDDDRSIRNYFIKNENGHVSTKKSILEI